MGMIYRRKKRDPTTGKLIEVGPYWMKYYMEGRPIQEGAKTFDRAEARRLLKEREGDVARGLSPGPKFDRIRFEDLAALMKQDYQMNKRKTARRVEEYLLHLEPFFRKMRVLRMTRTSSNVKSVVLQMGLLIANLVA